jgi:preprotein translocase subunit SecA
MQKFRKTLTAFTNTIRKPDVFSIVSSSENRTLRWAEDCADRAVSLDFSSLTDAQLRREFQASADLSDPSQLAKLLSLASTAVNRRLGAWRIFDTSDEALTKLQDIAYRVSETANFTGSIKYFIEPDFADAPIFQQMLDASLDTHEITGQERTIIRGLIYAAEKRKSALPEDTLLSAEFYDAISELDDSLKFIPTRQQIITAALVTRGVIVEMDAGEGKTISTALAALAFAATGSRVHVLTANDYLALRDAEWLEPVYESLGVSIEAVTAPMDEDERRSSYARTVVYSTVREIGFDYLKDNLKLPSDRPVQSGFDVAIVDEADHVLIDQHRTPLIISSGETADIASIEKSHGIVRRLLDLHSQEVAKAEQELESGKCSDTDAELAMLYAADPENETLKRIAAQRGDSGRRLLTDLADIEDTSSALDFENRYYYRVDTRSNTVQLTERGEAYIDANLETSDSDRRWAAHSQAHQFLRAYALFTRNIDYVVEDDSVILVDPFNGRLLPDNRYMNGLQTALEAKEGLPPTPDAETLAQITIPGLMGRYAKVSGLTGTAVEAQDDFLRDYGLATIRVEPSEASRRTDFPPTILDNAEAQQSAILAEVKHWRTLGRPVLIGTTNVEESEEISTLLAENSIPHNLLNAVHSELEAQIIRDAGSFGAVTVATNMAGRGTDIILESGLNKRILGAVAAMISDNPRTKFLFDCATSKEASMLADELAKSVNAKISINNSTNVEVTPSNTNLNTEKYKTFGLGLCVISIALNTSSRIDRQLRGRAGRQGAFGAAKLIISSQDSPIAFSRYADSIRRAKQNDTNRMQKLVETLQSESDADAQSNSAYARDYSSIQEAQTLSFYKWRQEIMRSDNWLQRCSDSTTRWAADFTTQEFALLADIGYESVFDQIQNTLWADLGIDCDWMYGLGESELSYQLGVVILNRVKSIGDELGQQEFEYSSNDMVVRTADEMWPQHLEYMQELSISCAIAGPTHRSGVGEFIEQAHKAYLKFLNDVNREAMPRIIALGEIETQPNQMEQPIVIDNEILSVLA